MTTPTPKNSLSEVRTSLENRDIEKEKEKLEMPFDCGNVGFSAAESIFTFFNMKWTYIGAFLIFEVGSIICAAASTSTVFIIGRALAGVGAAGMFCGGLLIIAHAVPKIKRPLYMSTVSTMYGIAAVAGPLLGGLITDSKKLTWRFCFWLNVPFGVLAMAYYVPIYFQAVRSLSAQDSGLRTLIFGVTIAIATLAAGYLVTRLGYYVPFMIIGAAIFALGSGLLTSLKLDSGPEKWLSYQVVAGIGYGIPSLMPFYALQAVLSDEDVPTANALIMFSQCLGGSLGLSIAQNIFSSELVKGLRGIEGVNVQMVVDAGASDVVRVVEGLGVEVVQKVLEAYNGGLTKAFCHI
ncbi:putative Vacuolar basic amino acid transporter 5 [Glarea lozoyensis 74030]|uniref:Putative Vacuolar basic amino acid transporter 5 n=1 Tax=Glarea lozoyensis (strain ATCC 74030 / MF5533) TaxID=1104152 RepID=H0EKX7_GLAL7|nr:putative Vacuolar basic amino acid transporter 5 [Glarea lozoyensis 74030]